MTRLFLIPLLALLFGCQPVDDAPPSSPPAPDDDWELVWADEFDGAHLDTTAWTPVVMPDPYNEELQYYTDRIDDAPGANAWLEDGALVIEARAEAYEHRRYTSARLNTQHKKTFLYGRFEARIKQPAEVGMWPAFWLLGTNIDSLGWPACGEIDIMEGKGRLPDWTSSALHGGPNPQNNLIRSTSYTLPSGNFHDEWHVFAVEWEPTQIRWYVDDVLYHTRNKADEENPDPAYWPFDHGHPFFIILNLAVGGWFDQGHPPPEDMTPQHLYVDYVRVYQSADGS